MTDVTLTVTPGTDLALPGAAFNADEVAVLFISGGRYGGDWIMNASLTADGDSCGEFEVLRSGVSTQDPRYPDLAVRAAERWLLEQAKARSWLLLSWENLNAAYGPADRPYFTLARAIVGSERFEPAPGVRYADEDG